MNPTPFRTLPVVAVAFLTWSGRIGDPTFAVIPSLPDRYVPFGDVGEPGFVGVARVTSADWSPRFVARVPVSDEGVTAVSGVGAATRPAGIATLSIGSP